MLTRRWQFLILSTCWLGASHPAQGPDTPSWPVLAREGGGSCPFTQSPAAHSARCRGLGSRQTGGRELRSPAPGSPGAPHLGAGVQERLPLGSRSEGLWARQVATGRAGQGLSSSSSWSPGPCSKALGGDLQGVRTAALCGEGISVNHVGPPPPLWPSLTSGAL